MGLFRRKRKEKDEAGLHEEAPAKEPERERITPVDVQQQVFRLAFRGYNERDVDEFLDVVTEDLASLHEENKRLRDALELTDGDDGGMEEARRHAEETVRKAREEAARIVEEAERQAGLVDLVGSTPATPAFLVREREFLQDLAALIQDHAGFLKEEARRANKTGAEPAPEVREEEPAEPDVAPPETEESEPPLEATAPMAPVGAAPDEEDEQELMDWSNPFVTEEQDEDEDEDPFADGAEAMAEAPFEPGLGGDAEDEAPSLRELFWGEE